MTRHTTLSEALSNFLFLLKSVGFENFVMKFLVFACDENSDLKFILIFTVNTARTMDLEYVGSC